MDGGWEWHIPEGAHENPKVPNPESVSAFGNDEHLRAQTKEIDL